ncbi:MAG TPA: HAMP domain-containing protein [Thermoflexia bacterium]|jgi:PAS domain S-box-containing protein|nr:HAMP domain-containing protein [Thermoflexia bacterium]
MELELWGRWFVPIFDLPARWWTYLSLAAYLLGWLVLVLRHRREFAALGGRQLVPTLILLVLTPLTNNFLLLRVPSARLLPPPYLAAQPMVPTVPLLGLLLPAAAAAWMGVGPAAVLGLLAGIVQAGTTTHNILAPFNLALEAALIVYLLRQDYQGTVPHLARHPLVALPTAVLVVWPLCLFTTFVSTYRPMDVLTTLDYAWTLERLNLGLYLLSALISGAILELAYVLGGQRVRPQVKPTRTPPYARTLSRRFIFTLLPLFILLMVALTYAVVHSAISIASQQAIEALARDGLNGADHIASFIATGGSLIRQFATDQVLWEGDPTLCQNRLQRDMEMLPYFTRLTAYDADRGVLCTYPEGTEEEMALLPEEDAIFDIVYITGGSTPTQVYRGLTGGAYISFLSPLEDPLTQERHGVLVGRVDLLLNPSLSEILSGLQRTMQEGVGFVIDAEGRIVAHPDQDRLFHPSGADTSTPPLLLLPDERGWVREGLDSLTNARQLVCQVAVEGYPWSVVIQLPYKIVLETAIHIATPLLALLFVVTGATVVVVLTITRQLTRPLNLLADAAGRIAGGDLENPIHVRGGDEVARLGEALEKMRLSLRDRLHDLSLLLQVSQAVSASLDLSQGIPPILKGVLEGTGGRVARILLLSPAGEPQRAVSRGEGVENIGLLDRYLTHQVREKDGPVQIEDLSQALDLPSSAPPLDRIRAAIAFPVRTQNRIVGVLWVGYGEPHQFPSTEVDLLNTIVGQTAVLIEKARLFQMAEGGRRRLSTILSSTRDAILVTDRQNRLLLINPAAEQALGLTSRETVGRRVDEIPLQEQLAHVLTAPIEPGESLVAEVPLPNGRVYYANASVILDPGGGMSGRVVALRDITSFKELDKMKSEFVATVSHDLRAPLTFIRGYVSMLPMIGPLTEKQQEYVEKILNGIEQISRLVEDLLNLGRIEAGVGLEKKPCHLGALVVEAVDRMRAQAAAKGLTLRLEASEPAPVILGDATLLRQAVANLVDNAIKYTPSGGLVTVGLRTTEDEVLITVKDTGIGIAPEDQVRLFEKFYRIRRKETGEIQGTGLGLAIVKSIVERHGGRVWVESALNQGSTFTIALPLRPPEE